MNDDMRYDAYNMGICKVPQTSEKRALKSVQIIKDVFREVVAFGLSPM